MVPGEVGALRSQQPELQAVDGRRSWHIRASPRLPELQCPLQVAAGLGEAERALRCDRRLHRGRQGSGVVSGRVPVPGELGGGRTVGEAPVRRQRLGTGPVEGGPLRREELFLDGLAQQAVPEGVAAASWLDQEQLLVHALADAPHQLLLGEPAEGGKQLVADGHPRDRHHGEHRGCRRAQVADAGQQHLAEGGWQVLLAGNHGSKQLLGKEGVASRAGPDGIDDVRPRGSAQDVAELAGHLRPAEAPELDELGGGPPYHLGEPGVEGVPRHQGVASVGADEEEAVPPEVSGEEREQVPGGAVRPVQVFDHQHDRAEPGRLLDDPEDGLEDLVLGPSEGIGTHGAGMPGGLRLGIEDAG